MKEKKVHRCPFLTVVVCWGEAGVVLFITLILFFSICLYVILSSGEGDITLCKKRAWLVCKGTPGVAGVGFKRAGENIFTF